MPDERLRSKKRDKGKSNSESVPSITVHGKVTGPVNTTSLIINGPVTGTVVNTSNTVNNNSNPTFNANPTVTISPTINTPNRKEGDEAAGEGER